jgi:hypothetical protein
MLWVFKLSFVVDILAFLTWGLFWLFFKKLGELFLLSSGHSGLVCHRRNETCQTPLFPPLEKIPKTPESASPGSFQQWWSFTGPGELTYTFSAERLRISAPHQASVGRASRRGSAKQKSADVEWKTYTLIYHYPSFTSSPPRPNVIKLFMSVIYEFL